jgi:hypothetical protein
MVEVAGGGFITWWIGHLSDMELAISYIAS